MSFLRVFLSTLGLVGLLVSPLGCGKGKSVDPEVQRRTAELGEVYEMFTMYAKKNQRPPKQVADLRPFQEIAPVGFQALKNGQYVAVWGVSPIQGSGEVLAYEKDAPKQGGTVLLADGSIKTMSADELQGALKSKS